MEIALLSPNSIRIKGKLTTIAVDGFDKSNAQAVLLITKKAQELTLSEETVLIEGTGEYEIGGIKITGLRGDQDMVYTLTVDGVDIAIGNITALNKVQHKLKENNIIIVLCNVTENASFVTSLASNVILFYGEKAGDVSATFGKEQLKTTTKYSVTKDKLPTEVETILLA